MTQSQQRRATTEEVEREASRYIVHKLGDRLWAGEPTYDERHDQWNVAIHARGLSPDMVLDHLTLDVSGAVVRAPSRRTLQRAVQRHQAPAPASAPLPSLAFARGEVESAEALPLPDLPDDPQAIGQEVLSDPETQRAYRCLKRALADPQMRPTVLKALEAFARAARPE